MNTVYGRELDPEMYVPDPNAPEEEMPAEFSEDIEWEKAHEIGRQALQFHEKNSSLLYRLAGCKIRLGNKIEAHLIFDKIKNEIF